MNRRESVIAILALGTAPLVAEAQSPAKPARIVVLGIGSPKGTGYLVDAFIDGMRELGYIEGKNVVYEYRWAEGKSDRLPQLAKEVVALKPDIILASGSTVLAAHDATTTIPIVAANTADPVGIGLAKSLSRPGGNITGVASTFAALGPKQLELLLAIMPKLARVAVLLNPSEPNSIVLESIQAAGQKVSVAILPVAARNPNEIDDAFARIAREHVGAIIVFGAGLFIQQRHQVAELTSKARLPSIFQLREDVEAGALMSYGVNISRSFRRAAIYADKILKGAKPGELPFEQATTLDLVVNLKTARALGITIPESILFQADKVIQ